MTPNLQIRSFSNDQYVLDKVFYSNFYRLKSFKEEEKKPVIVDIGAHCGYFSFAALALGAQKIFAFEPFLENYKMLLKNLGDGSMGQVVSYQMGVYVTDVTLTFGYPKFIKGNFFDFSHIAEDVNTDSIQKCIAYAPSLDNLLHSFVKEEVDILKISIGYAESDILFGSRLVEQIKHICGESTMTVEQQLEFKKKMGAKGFIDAAIYPVDGEEGKVLFHLSRTNASEVFKQDK